MKKFKFLILFFSVSLLAQTAQTPAKAPELPPAMKAKFWRAQFEVAQAQTRLNAVVEEMKKACADQKLTLKLDAQGEPVCEK